MGKRKARKTVLRFMLPLLLIGSLFVPLPYYIFQPGSAEELQPIVTVQGGQKDETGAFMLTTVNTISVRNIYYWAYGAIMPNRELVPKEQVDRGMTDEDYEKLLQHMMSTSQESAVVAAMRYLDKRVDIRYLGVVVRQVLPESKAKGILEVGDLIVKVDDKSTPKREDLVNYLRSKKPGDHVQVEFERDKQTRTADIELIALPDPNGDAPEKPKRAGLGFEPLTKQKVENQLPVAFQTENIGGPSAGLMFSLEIISQLTPGDLTKGHKIAGTGTIDGEGNVGQIGGIEHKIVAASDKGAEIFFAPADIQPDDSNTRTAMKKAKEIGATMKVVPVKTLAEAMNYLKNLP